LRDYLGFSFFKKVKYVPMEKAWGKSRKKFMAKCLFWPRHIDTRKITCSTQVIACRVKDHFTRRFMLRSFSTMYF